MGVSMAYFEAYGHRTAYVHHPGEGIPVLLIHGVGSARDTWGDIPDRLAALGRTVVAVDLLGHGDSGVGNGDYSLGANATAIRDLLDHLAIERAHIVGHSLGGGVAMQFTHQFPERVESLTLVASGGLGPDVSPGLRAATLPGASTVIGLACSPRVLSTLRTVDGAAMAVRHEPVLGERVLDKMERLQDKSRLRAFVETVRSVVNLEGQRVSALELIGKVDPGRVLIIWGDADPMVPISHGHHAARLLPGSRLVIVHGAKHHPHTDAPALVTAEIAEHLARCEVESLHHASP